LNFLLFGPPGAGKGTQSELLVANLGVKHISTGDILRSAMKQGTPLGLEAKKFVDAGALVPDSLMIQLIEEILDSLGSKSFLLDGFPRTIPQAQALDEMLSRKRIPLDRAVFLDVDKKLLIDRLSGRRICSNCGATYHTLFARPKKDNACDKCGGSLYQRNDDRADVIENRLVQYDQNTAAVKDYYAKAGKFVRVDGMGEPQEIYSRLVSVLKAK